MDGQPFGPRPLRARAVGRPPRARRRARPTASDPRAMIRRVQTADVVVIGSGAFGASTAYHLARRGARVALLDQHALSSQTSPRAAGLTSKAAASMPIMAQLRHEAVEAL